MNVLPQAKRKKVIDSFHSGNGIRKTTRETGVAKNTVTKIYREVVSSDREKEILCPCGLSILHQGWCSFRFKQSKARQRFIRFWHSGRDRNELILNNLDFARCATYKQIQKIGRSVVYDVDDIIQEASVGLILAVDKYIPKLNDKLIGFARQRIEGQIMDGKRNTMHKKRNPDDPKPVQPDVVSTEEENIEEIADWNVLSDESIYKQQLKMVFAQAMKLLSDKQREVIQKMFFEEKRQSDVAREMGYSETMILYWKKQALLKLKKFMLENKIKE